MSYALEKDIIRQYISATFTEKTISVEPEELKLTPSILQVAFERGAATGIAPRGVAFQVENILDISGQTTFNRRTPDAAELFWDRIVTAFKYRHMSPDGEGGYLLDGQSGYPQGDFVLRFGLPAVVEAAVDENGRYAWTVATPYMRRQSG